MIDAARVALDAGNIDMLGNAIKSGYSINEPFCEDGDTLLHLAVLYKQTNAVVFLLNNGARQNVRNALGQRPIDRAFDVGNMAVCDVLSVSNDCDRTIGGWSEGMLREIFLWDCQDVVTNDWYLETFPTSESNRITYIAINDKPIHGPLLEWFHGFWPNSCSLMRAEDGLIERAALSTGTLRTVQVRIEAVDSGVFRWIKRCDDGSKHAFSKGRLVRKYGTWLRLLRPEYDSDSGRPLGAEWADRKVGGVTGATGSRQATNRVPDE
jgi:hypothetical protein